MARFARLTVTDPRTGETRSGEVRASVASGLVALAEERGMTATVEYDDTLDILSDLLSFD